MRDLSTWKPCPAPGSDVLTGARVRLEPLDWARHGAGLYAATGGQANADLWRWMPVGPFRAHDELESFLARQHETEGWRTLTILSQAAGEVRGPEVLGMCTFMRIREAHGSCEIGCVAFGPKLRRTAEATEALHLMARHAFALGYRRYEWKCNEANAASMRAAERFGFTFEGVFRNDMVTKGQSRNTAWWSITDTEWPALDEALTLWLAPSNFGADGSQLRTLTSLRG